MRQRRVVAGMMSVLLASGCASTNGEPGVDSSPTPGSGTQDNSSTTTSAAEKTTHSTASTTPQSDVASATTSGGDGASPASPGCDADVIAGVLGREGVIVENCLDEWAYVYSDVPGDTGAFVQRVDGEWQDYDRQPSTRCRPEAKDDGVPDPLLKYFRGCNTRSPEADLGLSTQISQPACDGSGIVVLGAATTPGDYPADVRELLQQYPGSGYLRTDETCPSLAQQTSKGADIYAVYRPAGNSRQSICAAVREAGGDAYGKRLDHTSDPDTAVDC